MVINLLPRGGYWLIRKRIWELNYDIKGMLALDQIRFTQTNSE